MSISDGSYDKTASFKGDSLINNLHTFNENNYNEEEKSKLNNELSIQILSNYDIEPTDSYNNANFSNDTFNDIISPKAISPVYAANDKKEIELKDFYSETPKSEIFPSNFCFSTSNKNQTMTSDTYNSYFNNKQSEISKVDKNDEKFSLLNYEINNSLNPIEYRKDKNQIQPTCYVPPRAKPSYKNNFKFSITSNTLKKKTESEFQNNVRGNLEISYKTYIILKQIYFTKFFPLKRRHQKLKEIEINEDGDLDENNFLDINKLKKHQQTETNKIIFNSGKTIQSGIKEVKSFCNNQNIKIDNNGEIILRSRSRLIKTSEKEFNFLGSFEATNNNNNEKISNRQENFNQSFDNKFVIERTMIKPKIRSKSESHVNINTIDDKNITIVKIENPKIENLLNKKTEIIFEKNDETYVKIIKPKRKVIPLDDDKTKNCLLKNDKNQDNQNLCKFCFIKLNVVNDSELDLSKSKTLVDEHLKNENTHRLAIKEEKNKISKDKKNLSKKKIYKLEKREYICCARCALKRSDSGKVIAVKDIINSQKNLTLSTLGIKKKTDASSNKNEKLIQSGFNKKLLPILSSITNRNEMNKKYYELKNKTYSNNHQLKLAENEKIINCKRKKEKNNFQFTPRHTFGDENTNDLKSSDNIDEQVNDMKPSNEEEMYFNHESNEPHSSEYNANIYNKNEIQESNSNSSQGNKNYSSNPINEEKFSLRVTEGQNSNLDGMNYKNNYNASVKRNFNDKFNYTNSNNLNRNMNLKAKSSITNEKKTNNDKSISYKNNENLKYELEKVKEKFREVNLKSEKYMHNIIKNLSNELEETNNKTNTSFQNDNNGSYYNEDYRCSKKNSLCTYNITKAYSRNSINVNDEIIEGEGKGRNCNCAKNNIRNGSKSDIYKNKQIFIYSDESKSLKSEEEKSEIKNFYEFPSNKADFNFTTHNYHQSTHISSSNVNYDECSSILNTGSSLNKSSANPTYNFLSNSSFSYDHYLKEIYSNYLVHLNQEASFKNYELPNINIESFDFTIKESVKKINDRIEKYKYNLPSPICLIGCNVCTKFKIKFKEYLGMNNKIKLFFNVDEAKQEINLNKSSFIDPNNITNTYLSTHRKIKLVDPKIKLFLPKGNSLNI